MIKKSVIFVLIILVFSFSLLAEDGSEHSFDWGSLIGKILNSAILFGGLFLWLRKPIIEFLTKQSIEIRDDISRREKSLNEKSDSVKLIEERLSKIEDEIKKMNRDAVRNGEEEKKRIEKLANDESERILKNSEMEIEARIESSVRSLKEKIADLTIKNFRDEFKNKLNGDLHKKIMTDNIDIIGEINERN